VASSIEKNKLDGSTYSDLIAEAFATGGFITLASGDQVELHKVTDREIRAAYAMGRKEDSATSAAQKSLLKTELTKEEAVKLSHEFGNESTDATLEGHADDTMYTLKVTFEPVDTDNE
jgi:hypothetical protein